MMKEIFTKIVSMLKHHFGLDYPKCSHRKLYRLPHDLILCAECFRGWNFRMVMWDSIKLSNKELEKLFELQKLDEVK